MPPTPFQGTSYRCQTDAEAFHSPLMEPMLDAFEAAAGKVSLRPARIPLASNVTGAVADEAIATPGYLRESIITPQRKVVMGFSGSMPRYDFRDDEVSALVAYLESI